MGSKQWGGRRPGAGRPREYVKVPVWSGAQWTDRVQVIADSDLTICLAEEDDRRGVLLGDIWYGAGEVLAVAEYVERHRDWLSQISTRMQLVAFARQIAIYRGYDDLVNGLQPAKALQDKYDAEVVELKDALAHKTWLHALHECADVLYYAACLDEQQPESDLYTAARRECVQVLRAHQITVTASQVEASALAKYHYRASAPGMKDEEMELSLIEAAITRGKGPEHGSI